MIVHGLERIFCYDNSDAKVEEVTDASQIVAMNRDMESASDCKIFIRKLTEMNFARFKVPFLRHDNIFYTRFGNDPIFLTNRGEKLMSKIGKNDLIYMYDHALALCKAPILEGYDENWFEIKSDSDAFAIVNGLLVLI